MILRRATAAVALIAVAASAHSLWNLRRLRTAPTWSDGRRSISVLLPLRNEVDRMGPCLQSLAALRGVHEVLVLDDNSDDGTGAAAAAILPRVIGSREEPPAGWLGKPYACQRLADAASGEILIFVDADVVLTPDAGMRAAALLDRVDAVCPYPRQIADGPVARLVQPLLQWSWLTFLPLDLVERTRHPMVTAGNGQLLVVTRQAYRAAGGHRSVRDKVLEDLELMRQIKRAGYRVGMADGTDLAVCRMYGSDADLIDGYGKSLHAAFGPGTAAVLVLVYLLPVAAAFSRDRATRRWALVGYAGAVAGRAAVAHRTGGRPADALAHPASVAALALLYLRSLVGRRRGSLTWRGRSV